MHPVSASRGLIFSGARTRSLVRSLKAPLSSRVSKKRFEPPGNFNHRAEAEAYNVGRPAWPWRELRNAGLSTISRTRHFELAEKRRAASQASRGATSSFTRPGFDEELELDEAVFDRERGSLSGPSPRRSLRRRRGAVIPAYGFAGTGPDSQRYRPPFFEPEVHAATSGADLLKTQQRGDVEELREESEACEGTTNQGHRDSSAAAEGAAAGGRRERSASAGAMAAMDVEEDLDFVFVSKPLQSQQISASLSSRKISQDEEGEVRREEEDSEALQAQASEAAARARQALQARLRRAKSLQELLALLPETLPPTSTATTDETTRLDALHAATALHRFARFCPRHGRETQLLLQEPKLLLLFQVLDREGALEELSAQGLCCLLWALARLHSTARPQNAVLGFPPARFARLLELCAATVPSCSAHQLATALHALARLASVPQGSVHPPQGEQHLLETLHQEIRRRQRSLGPGGTSAMDTVLVADSLAKLQVRDDVVFASLAKALTAHLQAGEAGGMGIREVRHAVTAFTSLGFADVRLFTAVGQWLVHNASSCSTEDLTAIAFALSRSGTATATEPRLFQVLALEVQERLGIGSGKDRSASGGRRISSREAAALLYTFSHANVLLPSAQGAQAVLNTKSQGLSLAEALAQVVAQDPRALNGQDLALVVPCLSPALGTGTGDRHALEQLVERLTNRAIQCSGTLSPRQLARLMCGFGDAGARDPRLWERLGSETLARGFPGSFAAPDFLRVLAGLDAADLLGPASPAWLQDLLEKAIFGKHGGQGVREKLPKLLSEELLALLQLWPRLIQMPSLKAQRQSELPSQLISHLVRRLDRTRVPKKDSHQHHVAWQAPPELALELLHWLPESRCLFPLAQEQGGQLEPELLRAMLSQLPGALQGAPWQLFERLLGALAETNDFEVLLATKKEIRKKPAAFQRTFESRLKEVLHPAEGNLPFAAQKSAAATAFRCAALGFDGPALKELLRVSLQRSLADAAVEGFPESAGSMHADATWIEVAALLCWASAELRSQTRTTLRLTAKLAEKQPEAIAVSRPHATEVENLSRLSARSPLSFLRLAWASLALGGGEEEVRSLALRVAGPADASEDFARRVLPGLLTAPDRRPAQQLAWHFLFQPDGNADGLMDPAAPRQSGEGSPLPSWVQAFLEEQSPSVAPGRSGALLPQPSTKADRSLREEISRLLQHLRVPHVLGADPAAAAGTPALRAAPTKEGTSSLSSSISIYGRHVPIWFPEPQAILDIDTDEDRLASGAAGGAAELRRRQLRAAGLQVHLFDTTLLRERSRQGQLQAVAEAIAETCPEAAEWLQRNCQGASSPDASSSQRGSRAADESDKR